MVGQLLHVITWVTENWLMKLKKKRGYYYVIYFQAPSESIIELERNYRVNESILKFMFIKFDGKNEVAEWTKLSSEAAKKEQK
jgi:small subunit ribosomal protein S6